MPELIVPGGRPEEPPADSGPPAPVEVVTAFTIYTLPDGRTMVTIDLDAPLVPMRQPTSDDLFAMASIVVKDVINTESASMTANAVVAQQEQRMRQAMEMQQQFQLQQQLEKDKHKLAQAGRR